MLLSMLFNPIVWYVVFGVALLAIIGILCSHFTTLRWIFGTVLVCVLVGSAVYSCVQLNIYYTAEGGIYGYIETLLEQNKVNKRDDHIFDLGNVSFFPTSNKNEYTATFNLEDGLKLDDQQRYGIFINETPCSNMSYGKDHISAEFAYAFYDFENKEIAFDTLSIRVSIYGNYTNIFIKTTGGERAIKYWNDYFAKNGLVVSFEPFEFVS